MSALDLIDLETRFDDSICLYGAGTDEDTDAALADIELPEIEMTTVHLDVIH